MGSLHLIRSISKPKEVVEDIANMVIEDLENAGYRAQLVKHKRKISSWKIEPIDDLDGLQLQEFNEIKAKKSEEYIAMTKAGIQNAKQGLR